MRNIKPYLLLFVFAVAVPLCVTGYLWRNQSRQGASLDDQEQQLLLVMAAEISPESEMETIKMQAVIDRTRLAKAAEQQMTPPSSLSQQELIQLWGEENYGSYLEKFQEAVISTQNQKIICKGDLIYPEFHYLSNGHTRNMKEVYERKDFPYLQGTDSLLDLQEENYMKVILLDKKKFQKKCRETWDIPGEDIGTITTDGADYVLTISIDDKEISGEEFTLAFGLASPSFTMRDVGKQYRIVTKGVGHGFGVSQYGANEMAKMGATYDTILKYYYQDVTITSE